MPKRRVGVAALMALSAVVVLRGTAAVSPADEGRRVTFTGKVVDAACYMIHPPAASIPSHKDCGAACLARGVPLAIASDADGSLYFPADGNTQLAAFLDRRVKVTGTARRNPDAMELKMPVGNANQMSVRVDGGYNVITIQNIASASTKAAK